MWVYQQPHLVLIEPDTQSAPASRWTSLEALRATSVGEKLASAQLAAAGVDANNEEARGADGDVCSDDGIIPLSIEGLPN